jgi:hypothetical protein
MKFLLFTVSFEDLFPPTFVVFLVNKYLLCKMFNCNNYQQIYGFVIQGGFECACSVKHSAYFWRPEGQCGFRYVLFYSQDSDRSSWVSFTHRDIQTSLLKRLTQKFRSALQALRNKVIWGDLEKLSFCGFWGFNLMKRHRNTNSILK